MRLILALSAAAAVLGLMGESRRVSLPPIPWRVLSLGAGMFLAGMVVGVGPVVAGLAAAVTVVATRARDRITATRDSVRTAQRWPDFLAVVRGRIAAGDPLPDAVAAAGRSIGGRFEELDRAWGGSFANVLDRARDDWGDPIADRVFTTLRVAAITGGSHVESVLSNLSTSLAEEVNLRRAHRAALTQQQLTAGVALVSPWVILGLSIATNPQAGSEFATATGRMIIGLGAVATGAGYMLSRRAARLSLPPRVFR